MNSGKFFLSLLLILSLFASGCAVGLTGTNGIQIVGNSSSNVVTFGLNSTYLENLIPSGDFANITNSFGNITICFQNGTCYSAGNLTGVMGATGSTGTPGAAGQGFTWSGDWIGNTSYIPYDMVQDNGSAYDCILAVSGTTSPGSDSTHWSLVAAKGDQGNTGTIGTIVTNSGNITNASTLTIHGDGNLTAIGNDTTKTVTVTFNGNANHANTSDNATYAVTAGNGGVASVVAGSGISVSSNTGNVTITNTLTSAYTQGCRVYNDADESAAHSSDFHITFDSEAYDTDSMHMGNDSRVTFKTAGIYLVVGSFRIDKGGSGERDVSLEKNGNTSQLMAIFFCMANTSFTTYGTVSLLSYFNAGDYIELDFYNGDPSNAIKILYLAPSSPCLMVQRVG